MKIRPLPIADGKCKTAIDGNRWQSFSSKLWFYGLKLVKTNNFLAIFSNAKFLNSFFWNFYQFSSILHILVIIFVWECKKKLKLAFCNSYIGQIVVLLYCRRHAVCRRQIMVNCRLPTAFRKPGKMACILLTQYLRENPFCGNICAKNEKFVP